VDQAPQAVGAAACALPGLTRLHQVMAWLSSERRDFRVIQEPNALHLFAVLGDSKHYGLKLKACP
jgi:hypothetical protein